MMKETHMTDPIDKPGEWVAWFTEAGIDWVEFDACPDTACEICRAEPEVAAAA